jgi:chemotaxis protein methyltransferase CheR
MSEPFDMVLCRNVMMYFDNAVRKRLLDETYRMVRPDGYLLVGHAESLTGMMSSFKSVRPSIYVKR